MKFAVIIAIKENADMGKVQRLSPAEALVVWDFHMRGILQSMHHRADRPGAVAIMEITSEAALEAELNKLPLHDSMDFQIIPIVPYGGYADIWAK